MTETLPDAFVAETCMALLKKRGKNSSAAVQERGAGGMSAEFQQECISMLEGYASLADRVQLVTHYGKFHHTSSRLSGVNMAAGECRPQLLETPAAVRRDVVGGDAKYSRVVQLLGAADRDGVTFLEHILADDYSPLWFLDCDEERKRQWYRAFRRARCSGPPYVIDKYVRQLLFPLADGGYRNLVLHFPVALYRLLHDAIAEIRNGQAEREARALRAAGEYSTKPARYLHDMAQIQVGGANPRNVVSALFPGAKNVYLLNAAPPRLRFEELRIPTGIQSIFELRVLRRVIAEPLRQLNRLRHVMHKLQVHNRDLRMKQRERIGQAFYEVLCWLEYMRSHHEPHWCDGYAAMFSEHRALLDGAYYAELSRGERLRCQRVLAGGFMVFILSLTDMYDNLDRPAIGVADLMEYAEGLQEAET